MENIIAILFLSREVAHREHLKTSNGFHHVVLGEFYQEIIEQADRLAEAYQGRTKTRLTDIPYYSNSFKGDVAKVLEQLLKEVEEYRKECHPDDSPLQNIIDEVVDTFLSTIFKLENLK